MKILTSGIHSGLGRFVHERMGGQGLVRNMPDGERQRILDDDYDAIIHCAFNSGRDIDQAGLHAYLDDNVFLSNALTGCRHKKFIYLSSVEVYPLNDDLHSEANVIKVDSLRGIYAVSKLASEAIIQNNCDNFLILRPTTLLGEYSRKNNVVRLIEGMGPAPTLKGESVYNFVTHADVVGFIEYAIQKDLRGIYNVASSGNITLAEVAALLGRKVEFGVHTYKVGNIDNKKIRDVFPVFSMTSKECLMRFVQGKKKWLEKEF